MDAKEFGKLAMRYETKDGMTCCQMHRAAHNQLIAEMNTFFHLVPRTPRNVLHFYESLERRGLTAEAIKAGLSSVCPCGGRVAEQEGYQP